MMYSRRRSFLKHSAAALALGAGSAVKTAAGTPDRPPEEADFAAWQKRRRADLWALLGELPWDYRPAPPRLVGSEKHEGYKLERLVLDLNGMEPVPALLLLPDRRPARAPGLLFIHWHGGMYDSGRSGSRTAGRRRRRSSGRSSCWWGTTRSPPTLRCVPKRAS